MSYRILVVDDEESIRFTFSAFLCDAGYSVETAESLEEALDKIASQLFDAIFLDILLGRDSGIVALKASRESLPNTPVIMATGAPDVNTAAEAVRLGVDTVGLLMGVNTRPHVTNRLARDVNDKAGHHLAPGPHSALGIINGQLGNAFAFLDILIEPQRKSVFHNPGHKQRTLTG